MTKVRIPGWIGMLAFLPAVALPLRAAEEPGATKTHPCAVLVGINQYADSQIIPRAHAEADAQALYDLVTSKDYLGLAPDQVRLLLGSKDAKRPSDIATHTNIVNALKWAAANAGRNDLVIVAFMMEGAPLGDRACYLATDSTFQGRAKNALAAGDVQKALEKLKSQKFCAFVDVNFKGFKSTKGRVTEIDPRKAYQEFLSTGKEGQIPTGRVVFLPNGKLMGSIDLPDHGLFTKVVIDGLKGAADREGNEPDGVVTVDELVEYLTKELPPLNRKYGTNKDQKEQQPYILGRRASHFELTHNPAVAAKVKERLDKFAQLAAKAGLSKEVTAEGQKLLSRMPKLATYRSLRKEYQQLADGKISVDEFVKDRKRILDGLTLTRDVAAAFAAKVIQASQLIHKEYVKSTNQGDLIAAAVKGLYARIDEKIPEDIRQRLAKAKGLSEEELTTLLTDVRERLGKREDLANHKDIDYALQRMMAPLDPYTTYIDPETLRQFKIDTTGRFVGIGVQIRPDTTRDVLLVISPIKNSPAYYAGIKAGDAITQITRLVDDNGKPLDKPEVISTHGLSINEAVKKISGKAGTPIKVTVEREGADKPLDFEIKRGPVEVETVLGAKRNSDDSWNYVIDPESRICYIRLTQFSRNTERDLVRALNTLRREGGIKGLVLDLRFNPGGLLTSAVNISDLFIDDGLIVTIKPRVGRETQYKGEHENSLLDFPMVCLVNGHSASGSEIVSACLQDHHRAIIMGERSYGKGSVQNIQPFEGGEIKLTNATFWRPNGKNLNRASTHGREDEDWGVSPDKGYKLPLSQAQLVALDDHLRKQEIIPRHDAPAKPSTKAPFKDSQLDMAVKYLQEQVKLASRATTKKAG